MQNQEKLNCVCQVTYKSHGGFKRNKKKKHLKAHKKTPQILKLQKEINFVASKIMCDFRKNKKNYPLNSWFQKISQWRIKQFDGNGIEASLIVHNIEEIGFPNLNRIVLWNNKIESFQNLCRIDLPSLKSLNLDDNYSISIKTIRKINSKQLELIQLSANPINDSSSLVQFPSSKSMRLITFDYGYDKFQVSSNVSFLGKLSCFSLNQLKIASYSRIRQLNLGKVLKTKFKGIVLETKY